MRRSAESVTVQWSFYLMLCTTTHHSTIECITESQAV